MNNSNNNNNMYQEYPAQQQRWPVEQPAAVDPH